METASIAIPSMGLSANHNDAVVAPQIYIIGSFISHLLPRTIRLAPIGYAFANTLFDSANLLNHRAILGSWL